MSPIDEAALDALFRNARSHNGWRDADVPDDLLRAVYELARMGPTSANSSPARFLFLREQSSKEKLAAMVTPGNKEKVVTAPVVTIIGHDLRFYEHLPHLFAHNPRIGELYANDADLAATTAMRNSSLQGAYLMMAARSLGLDCGPMSGFDNSAVDETFFAGSNTKSNFLCGLGYGDSNKLFGRLPRLSFDTACSLL